MKIPDQSPKYRAALAIIKKLTQEGFEALFAGGFVRDMLMENTNDGDIDIATNAKPEAINKLFPHTIGVGEQFGVMIVVHQSIPFEVATFRSDIGINDGRHPANIVFTDSRHDAQRRDFTINGLFFNPISQQVIDYIDGKRDIAAGVIRAIGNPKLRFSEDYLRMLRAIRFAARFNFSIEAATWQSMSELVAKITVISVERIFTELDKMFRGPNPKNALDLLDKSGLLAHILPEVAALKGVEQPLEYHPEGDVFEHIKKALTLLPPNPSSVLAWSVLLHDIGKPPTMILADRIRFNNHDKVGSNMVKRLLKALHTSNELLEGVYACTDNHMNFVNVQKMRLSTLKKFLSRATIVEELELHRIDCLASHGQLDNYFFLQEQLATFRQETLKPDPLLHGKDLIAMGFKPGPLFSEILTAIYDLQLEETITNYPEAIAAVKRLFPALV